MKARLVSVVLIVMLALGILFQPVQAKHRKICLQSYPVQCHHGHGHGDVGPISRNGGATNFLGK